MVRRIFEVGQKKGSLVVAQAPGKIIRLINGLLTYGISDQNYPKHGELKKPRGVVK